MRRTLFLFVFFLHILPTVLSSSATAQDLQVTMGYFPNITHAHALIAQNMAARGEGWFEARIPGLHLKWASFNAGPSAMEALFAKAVDITYVGPNPALNAYVRSNSSGLHVVSGAVRGGAALVVPKDSPLAAPRDFMGKRVATPQLGNTQDIACRNWFLQAGLQVTMTGGDVQIIPTANPSIFDLFSTGEIDAAWTVEPWVSRLELEAARTENDIGLKQAEFEHRRQMDYAKLGEQRRKNNDDMNLRMVQMQEAREARASELRLQAATAAQREQTRQPVKGLNR